MLTAKAVTEIDRRIRSGEWPPGMQLPDTEALMTEFSIGKTTVEKAVTILRERGLIRTRQGLGRFVADPAGWAQRR